MNIGPLDATRVPQKMLTKGIIMEKFMQKYQSIDRENESEAFAAQMCSKVTGLRYESDSWLLNFKYGYERIVEPAMGTEFYSGISMQCQIMRNHFGMIYENERLSIGADKIRMIISRDPVLRNVLSPEEVLNLLSEYDINQKSQTLQGEAVLLATGMNREVAKALLDHIFSDFHGMYPSSAGGALSDDFSSALDIVNRGRMNKISYPEKMTLEQKIHILIYGGQMSIRRLFSFGEVMRLISVSRPNIGERLISRLPLTYAAMKVKDKVSYNYKLDLLMADLLGIQIKREIVITKSPCCVVILAGLGKTKSMRMIGGYDDIEERIRIIGGLENRSRIQHSENWIGLLLEAVHKYRPQAQYTKVCLLSDFDIADGLGLRVIGLFVPDKKFIEDFQEKLGIQNYEKITRMDYNIERSRQNGVKKYVISN